MANIKCYQTFNNSHSTDEVTSSSQKVYEPGYELIQLYFIVMWFTMNRSYYRWFIKWSTFSMRADCVLYYQTCVYIIIVWNGQKRKVVFVSVGISCSLVLCCCPQISLNHEIYFLNQLITNFMLLWQQGAQRINGRLCGTAEGTKIKLR